MTVDTAARALAARLAAPATRDAAMAELVDRYGARLHARIREVVGAGPDADDAFQNTLVKVLRHAGAFDGRSALFSWLYRVATNEALDLLRRRARRRARIAPAEEGGEGFRQNARTPDIDPERVRDLLAGALATLPPQQRFVFEERYYHETPYAELAARLGRSVGGLKANYHHAVRKVTAFVRAHAELTPS